MQLGVCYYPEHWPRDRWATDARLMREAGLSLVRIAEFAWSRMEPVDGRFDWGWLDEAIGILAGAGLDVILGTPTATPPAWLTQAHPDILRVDANGRRRAHGSRRHACLNSPAYQRYSDRIVDAMAHRYGGQPAIIGWQIDNEWGGGRTARCYCDLCAAAFRRWLQARYGSVEALNESWGAIFWSQTYDEWAQVQPPGAAIDKPNPSHELDYFRFASDSTVSYQGRQIAQLRPHCGQQFITTNFMGLFPDLDQFDLAAPLDLATWDSYPTGNLDRGRRDLHPPAGHRPAEADFAYDVGDPAATGLAHALTYGLKEAPFWVMEQQAGQINWGDVNPGIRPGTPRLWSWHAAATGASAVVYFRWRATRLAQEQYHSGLLRHDGTPDIGLAEVARLRDEAALLAAVAAGPPAAEVALLFRFEDLWAIGLQPHRADFSYLRPLYLYYQALQRLGIPAAVVGPAGDWSRYKLLIAPTVHLLDDGLADRLAAYVAGGGQLLLGVRSGFKTASNLVTDEPLPGRLRPLVGATVTDWQSLPDGVSWPVTSALPGLAGRAGYWVERLAAATAVPLASYDDGTAALTAHAWGDGRCYYLGWYPDPAQARALATYLAEAAGVTPLASLPPGLIAHQRGDYLILLNFTDQPLTARIGAATLTVDGRDIRVMQRP